MLSVIAIFAHVARSAAGYIGLVEQKGTLGQVGALGGGVVWAQGAERCIDGVGVWAPRVYTMHGMGLLMCREVSRSGR